MENRKSQVFNTEVHLYFLIRGRKWEEGKTIMYDYIALNFLCFMTTSVLNLIIYSSHKTGILLLNFFQFNFLLKHVKSTLEEVVYSLENNKQSIFHKKNIAVKISTALLTNFRRSYIGEEWIVQQTRENQ